MMYWRFGWCLWCRRPHRIEMIHPAATNVTTGPSSEPVTLDQAKAHLRVDFADADADITLKLQAAREDAEDYTWRKLLTQQIDVYWNAWPRGCNGELLVPFGNLQSLTDLQWKDVNGNVTVMVENVDYVLDKISEPAVIRATPGKYWPLGCLYSSLPISAHITCGWVDTASIPAKIKSAILLQAGHLWANREAVVMGKSTAVDSKVLARGVDDLLSAYRLFSF